MTIEIQPELEEIIQQRLATGAFEDVEGVLAYALRNALTPAAGTHGITGEQLLTMMRASPLKNIDLHVAGLGMPVRNVSI